MPGSNSRVTTSATMWNSLAPLTHFQGSFWRSGATTGTGGSPGSRNPRVSLPRSDLLPTGPPRPKWNRGNACGSSSPFSSFGRVELVPSSSAGMSGLPVSGKSGAEPFGGVGSCAARVAAAPSRPAAAAEPAWRKLRLLVGSESMPHLNLIRWRMPDPMSRIGSRTSSIGAMRRHGRFRNRAKACSRLGRARRSGQATACRTRAAAGSTLPGRSATIRPYRAGGAASGRWPSPQSPRRRNRRRTSGRPPA